MTRPTIVPILFGGSHTHLQPLNRKRLPKRFVLQNGNKSPQRLKAEQLALVEQATGDALMCMAAEDHRFLVPNDLRAVGPQNAKLPQATMHRRVARPWGWYDSIDMGDRFQVKRIGIKPGASLSLQKHHHRAEHWIVVQGTAEVTNGDKVFLLSENQSTYIPIGEEHRLRYPGKLDLEMIEVQSGSYLGEDGIVRQEDTYGRVSGPRTDHPKDVARLVPDHHIIFQSMVISSYGHRSRYRQKMRGL